jgi:hypothetical protein
MIWLVDILLWAAVITIIALLLRKGTGDEM